MSFQDLSVIAIYLVLLCTLGWGFRRFTGNLEEYFAGGRNMPWWLLGAHSFQSNFSCWVFTGAAGVAYTHGTLIFGFYLVDLLGFALAYWCFAARFRQLGVVTAMDAVRERFGVGDERFFALLSTVISLAFASMRVLGLSVLFAHAFGFSQQSVIVVTMAVIVVVAMLGGSWAIAAMNLLQMVVVISVTTVVAVLAIIRTGGWHAFIAQIPAGHWDFFKPTSTTPYDWVFILSGLFGASYAKNNLVFVSKYVGARDSQEARKSVLIPLAGYLTMPVIWMIPAFAAFTLAPELAASANNSRVAEESYMAVCLRILPPGLLGLIVVCMLATTASSVGLALNINSGAITQNLYRSWRGSRASAAELLLAGKLATLAVGLIVGGGCLALSVSSLTLFDLLLYIGAYLGTPVAIPLFLGLYVRNEAWWVPRATVIFGIVATVGCYHGLPALLATWTPSGFGGEMLGYFSTHRFVATNLLIVPASMLFFIVMARRSRPLRSLAQSRQAAFFSRLNRTRDAAETASEKSAPQDRLIGKFLAGLAALLLALSLFADSTAAWASIASCAIIPGVLAVWLLVASRPSAS